MFELIAQSYSQTNEFIGVGGPRGGGINMGYMIILGVCSLVSMLVSGNLKRKFKKFSQVPVSLSGAEIAEKMLKDNGIHDVQIISARGQLTDHYNPMNKTVNLSEVVYNERNAAAAAVAAHEVGHAVQHATAYSWLQMRSKMVPMLGMGSRFAPYIIMIGVAMMAAQAAIGAPVAMIGIVLFGLTTLFAFVTLPVEFDASNRAMVWIQNSGVMGTMERSKARSALNAAAMTYVVGALASLAQLIYFISMFLNRRN